MQKHQYVLYGAGDERHDGFCRRVMDLAAPALMALGSFHLKVTVTEHPPPLVSVIPFDDQPAALISLTGEELPEPGECRRVLGKHGEQLHGYRVTESIPRGYERDWKVGERTPGVGMLTTFRKKKGMDHQSFIDRWHGIHTPLALETHPVWNYVRNVVEESILDGSGELDAIVEEHFRHQGDLLNPVRFFGGALRMGANMGRTLLDVRKFIDLNSMKTRLVSEFVLRERL